MRTEAVQGLQEQQTEGFASLTQGLSSLSKATERDMSPVIQEACHAIFILTLY